jgi:uncharacterized protein (DUF302 family)
MYYIVETAKSFEQAVTDLETAVERHGFGVLHIHDLGTTLILRIPSLLPAPERINAP